MTDSYDDIINLPHYEPKRHPRMAVENRAGQFAPFAALTGHAGAIRETARLTDAQADIEEDRLNELDEKLMVLRARLSEKPAVTVTWFRPDERKAGGAYQVTGGFVKKIDAIGGTLVMEDGQRIPVSAILELTGEVFENEG